MVTDNHFRWDFLGLSTDTKPTPATSEKVVNGSTFYCSDNSKLYVFCKDTWYERKPLGSGGGGTTYTAGTGIDITEDTISIDEEVVATLEELNARIAQGEGAPTTSTEGVVGGLYEDTTNGKLYICTAITAGTDPDPDTYTWEEVGGGPTVVQTTGTSQTDVMSQDATTKMVLVNNDTKAISIGQGTISGTTTNFTAINGDISNNSGGSVAIGVGNNKASVGNAGRAASSVVIGASAQVNKGHENIAIGDNAYIDSGRIGQTDGNVALGHSAYINGTNVNPKTSCVALGAYSEPSRSGEVNVGAGTTGKGYNSTNYRVLGGVHDGQLAHDAVTVDQVNGVIDAINTALSTNIPHIGAVSQ